MALNPLTRKVSGNENLSASLSVERSGNSELAKAIDAREAAELAAESAEKSSESALESSNVAVEAKEEAKIAQEGAEIAKQASEELVTNTANQVEEIGDAVEELMDEVMGLRFETQYGLLLREYYRQKRKLEDMQRDYRGVTNKRRVHSFWLTNDEYVPGIEEQPLDDLIAN